MPAAKKTVLIAGKRYATRKTSQLARAEVKMIKSAQERAADGDNESLWDMLGVFVDAPQEVVDRVPLGEAERILREAGIVEGEPDGISLGESAASTVS